MSTAQSRKVRRRISAGSAGIRMTVDEFDAITEWNDLFRYELVHGVLVVSPIASPAEADPNEEMGHWLRTYRDHDPLGSALDKTLFERFIHLPHSRRRADRVIWAGLGRVPDEKVDVPTIVVEFVSKSKRDWLRDYVEKRAEYLALGVLEYWVIDRFRRTMTVFRNGEPAEQVFDETATYRTPLLPGFELPLARLLNVADDWKKKA